MLAGTDPETLAVVVIVLGSATLLAVLGYRIRAGETWLVAGYRPDSVGDDEGIARLVGTTTVAVAAVTAALGVAMLFVEPSATFWGSYMLVLLGAFVSVQVRGRRYA